MNPPQIIHTAAGDLVVIPREDYEALLAAASADDEAAEDAADVAAYDEAKAELAAGRDQALPREVGAAILKGASRLTAWRKFRNLSQAVLADQAGIGQGYLSQIERGERIGAPDTLKRLAECLDLSVDQIG